MRAVQFARHRGARRGVRQGDHRLALLFGAVADDVVRVVGYQTDGYAVAAVVVSAVESCAAFATVAATASARNEWTRHAWRRPAHLRRRRGL